jgi:hypothetical protein
LGRIFSREYCKSNSKIRCIKIMDREIINMGIINETQDQ